MNVDIYFYYVYSMYAVCTYMYAMTVGASIYPCIQT